VINELTDYLSLYCSWTALELSKYSKPVLETTRKTNREMSGGGKLVSWRAVCLRAVSIAADRFDGGVRWSREHVAQRDRAFPEKSSRVCVCEEISARERKVNALTCDADGTRNRAGDVRDKWSSAKPRNSPNLKDKITFSQSTRVNQFFFLREYVKIYNLIKEVLYYQTEKHLFSILYGMFNKECVFDQNKRYILLETSKWFFFSWTPTILNIFNLLISSIWTFQEESLLKFSLLYMILILILQEKTTCKN